MKEIFRKINNYDQRGSAYIFEQIKQELKKAYPSLYKEWENKGFDPDHLFKFENDSDREYKGTLLHLAAENGCTNIVDTLIYVGAGVNEQDSNGNTALHLVQDNGTNTALEAQRARTNSSTVNLLISMVPYLALDDCTKIISALRAKGANVNARNNDGDTPLHLAAKNGYINKVGALLDRGADADIKNNNNEISEQLVKFDSEAGYDILNILMFASRPPRA